MTPNGDISFLKQRFALSPGDLLEQVVIQLRPGESQICARKTEPENGAHGLKFSTFKVQLCFRSATKTAAMA